MGGYGCVYGLYDPLTGELRYIGQTTKPISRRLQAHMTPSSLARRSYRTHWFRSLKKRGLAPIAMELAQASSRSELDTLEIEYIARFRAEGCALTNIDSGGRSMSKEHRDKLRAMKIRVPRSEEVKAKISEARKGYPSPMKDKHHTEETKAKVSASRKGQLLEGAYHQYQHDISTEWILERLDEGWTKVAVAKELGKSPTFVHRRVNQARRTLGEGAYRKKRLPEKGVK